MTSRMRLRVYASVLAALIVVFVVGAIAGPRRGRALGHVFPGLLPAEVTAVEIGDGDSAVALRRLDETWVLDEGSRQFPARADRIDSLLEELSSSRLVRHVTGNRNLWADFGLDEGEGTQLVLRSRTDAGTEAVNSVTWGNTASDQGLTYLRVGATDDVYASDASVSFYLGQPVTYWSYLRVLPEDVAAGDVIAISGSVNAHTGEGEPLVVAFDFEKQSGEGSDADAWRSRTSGDASEDGGSPDASAVQSLLREVVDLVGSDFVRQSLPPDAPVVGDLDLSLSDGRSYAIEIRAAGDQFVCSASGPGLPGDPYGGLSYELTSAKLRRLFPDVKAQE